MRQDLSYEIEQVIPEVIQTSLYNCLCTIQQRTNTVSAVGQPDLADWVTIPTLQSLQAMASIARPFMPNETATVRQPQQFETETLIHVLLMGYYPSILQQNQCVLVGGPYQGTYEIMAVENDSQFTQTRLGVRVWTQ